MKCKSDVDLFIAEDKPYSRTKVLLRTIGIGFASLFGISLAAFAIAPVAAIAATSAGASAGTTAAVVSVAEGAVVASRVARVAEIVGIGTAVVSTGGAVSILISKAFPLLTKSIKKA